MKVVVASDGIAGLAAREASESIGRAFADRGAAVAVVPLAVSGSELRDALRDARPGAAVEAAFDAGEAGRVLARREGALVVDLTAATVDDLGRAALRVFAGDPVEALAVAREAWGGRDLVALVPDEQAARPLTGLEGLAATEGRAAGAQLSQVLADDAAAERWAASLGMDPGPGSGAAGGLGLIIQALGGRVVDPLTFLAEAFSLPSTLAQADVVVTGAETLDFHAVGGPVVKRVVAMAEAALRPTVAIVGRNFVSSRELRLAGLETAYPLLQGPGEEPPTPARLREVADQVATTWCW